MSIMKNYIALVAVSLIFITGCTTQYQARNYDDVYYSSKNKPLEIRTVVEPQQVQPAEPQAANAETAQGYAEPANSDTANYSAGEGDTYINNNFYSDDYYDYAYAARLRRFHNPYCFNSYYSDYYTNMYWYDYDPFNWGTSIYLGYNFWYPSYYYYPSYYRHGWYDWYYPNYGWYDPYPWYGGSGFYSGYNLGYWNGFYDGYWFGYHDNYYNSFDHNSSYYGPRNGGGSSGSLGRNNHYRTFGERYEAGLASSRTRSAVETRRDGGGSGTISPSRNNSGASRDITAQPAAGSRNATVIDNNSRNSGIGNGTTATGDRQPRNAEMQRTATGSNEPAARTPQYRYVNPGAANASREVPKANAAEGDRNSSQQPEIIQQRQQRYANPSSRNAASPGTQGVQRGTNVQPYSPPAYAKPRSSQEYTTPKYRNPRETDVTPSQRNNQGSGAPQNRSYSQPSRPAYNQQAAPRQNKVYQAPAPRNDNYSAPSRNNSSSTPSRSSGTYSAPSRSSSTYSAPSRSSGSYSSPSHSGSNSSSGSSRSSSSSSSGSSSSGHRR